MHTYLYITSSLRLLALRELRTFRVAEDMQVYSVAGGVQVYSVAISAIYVILVSYYENLIYPIYFKFSYYSMILSVFSV